MASGTSVQDSLGSSQQLHVHVPIRLTVDADTLSSRLDSMNAALTQGLAQALARVRSGMEARKIDAPAIIAPPTFTWRGPALAQVPAAAQQLLEQRIEQLIATQATKHLPPPANPSLSAHTKRRVAAHPPPWVVETDTWFSVRLGAFFELLRRHTPDMAQPGQRGEASLEEIYHDLLDKPWWGAGWLVRVNRRMGLDLLGAQVIQRFERVKKLNPAREFVQGFWSAHDASRSRLVVLDQNPEGSTRLPRLRQGGDLRLEGRSAALPGARLLFALISLPVITLEALLEYGEEHVFALPLRDLAGIISPREFEAVLGVSWDSYVAEFGDAMTEVHVLPFSVRKRVHALSVRALVREQLARLSPAGHMAFGGVHLLGTGLPHLPQLVREAAGQLSGSPEPQVVDSEGSWEKGWRGAVVYAELARNQSRIEAARYRPQARDDAAELASILNSDERPFGKSIAINTFLRRRYSPKVVAAPVFEFMLEVLEKELDKGRWFTVLFDAVEQSGSEYEAHLRLLELAELTRYRSHPRVRASLEVLRQRRESTRDHVFDEGWIILDRRFRVRVGEVLADKDERYSEKRVEQRLKPEAQKRLFKVAMEELGALVKLLLDTPEQEHDVNALGAQALERAMARAKIEDRDVDEVTVYRSLELVSITRRTARLTDTWDVSFYWVERDEGQSQWVRVRSPGKEPEVQSLSETDFWWRIFAWRQRRTAEVFTSVAKVITWGAVIVIAWEVGAIQLLISLGGGWWSVGVSIAISEFFYVISAEEITLEGALTHALIGYMTAVGFNLVTPAVTPLAKLIGKKISGTGLMRLVAGWIAERAIVGAAAGGSAGFLTSFVLDMINRAKGGKGLTVRDYLASVGTGMLLGAVFEVGMTGLGVLFREQGLHALQTLEQIADKLLREGVTSTRVAAESLVALRRFGTWLKSFLSGDKAKELEDGAASMLDRLAGSLKDNVRASLLHRAFEVSGLKLAPSTLRALEQLLKFARDTPSAQALLKVLVESSLKNPASISALQRVIEAAGHSAETRWLLTPFADAVLQNPKTLHSLLEHPEALGVLEKALTDISRRGPNAFQKRPTNVLPIKHLEARKQNLERLKADIKTRTGGKKPAQPDFKKDRSSDSAYVKTYVDDLYKSAEAAKTELEELANAVVKASENQPKLHFRKEPKKRERTNEKVASYEGDASQVVDLLGCKIVYETLDDLYLGLAHAEKVFGNKIVQIKDRFVEPASNSGYRDILLNVKMSNGHIAEFRLHLKEIDKFADMEHALYELTRSLSESAKVLHRPFTAQELALFNLLDDTTQPIFNAALRKSGGLDTPGTP
jgi:ppGpp synthetase/RelA/SpoT-type nucleotidyltranferase